MVEVGNSVANRPQQFGIARHAALRSIGEIGKEAEEEVGLLVGEEPDFEFLDLAARDLGAGEHHGDHHQGGLIRGNPLAEIHFGQRFRRKKRDDQRVDDLDGQFTQRKEGQRAEYREHGLLPHAGVPGQSQTEDGKAQGE